MPLPRPVASDQQRRWPALDCPRPAISDAAALNAPYIYLAAVGTDRGARAVVLKAGKPAGPGTSRRRNALDDGERERESQSNLAQHCHSPGVEARSGFCGLDRRTRAFISALAFEMDSLGTSLRVLWWCAAHISVNCLCSRLATGLVIRYLVRLGINQTMSRSDKLRSSLVEVTAIIP